MHFHLAVYALADRLRITSLRDLAQNKFEDEASTAWESSDFPSAIEEAYHIAPPGAEGEGLRKVVVRIAASQARALVDTGKAFRSTLESTAEFAADLVLTMAGGAISINPATAAKLKALSCPTCDFELLADVAAMDDLTCPACTDVNSKDDWEDRDGSQLESVATLSSHKLLRRYGKDKRNIKKGVSRTPDH